MSPFGSSASTPSISSGKLQIISSSDPSTSTPASTPASVTTGTSVDTRKGSSASSLLATSSPSLISSGTTQISASSDSSGSDITWPTSTSTVSCGQGTATTSPTPTAMNSQGASDAVSSFCTSMAAQTATLNSQQSQWAGSFQPPSDKGVSIDFEVRFNTEKPDCAPFFFAGGGLAHCASNLLAPINSCDKGSPTQLFGGSWLDDCSRWLIMGNFDPQASHTSTTTPPITTTSSSTHSTRTESTTTITINLNTAY